MNSPSAPPRIVIAGTHSGTGKTTITIGIIVILKRRGLRVQPFKVGPDYIDPGFHTLACGIPGRNLDSVMMGERGVRETFERAACKADISIIEGVMGLYDGFSGNDELGSTAQIAKIVDASVILCLDVRAMARSAAALALGYVRFDPTTPIRGFILNNVGSENHYKLVKDAVEHHTGVPVMGGLPKNPEITLPERHLGLVPAWERDTLPESTLGLAELIEAHIDIEKILAQAERAGEGALTTNEFGPEGECGARIDFSSRPESSRPNTEPRQTDDPDIFPNSACFSNTEAVRIGYALDDAFHFYYQDNLDIFRHMGAELFPFKPTTDEHLPEGVDGLYFGGGYPELCADRLEKNRSMRDEIYRAAEKGLPIYAECGGLMYLMNELLTFDGGSYQMVGVFPGRVVMEKKLTALGYYRGVALADTPIAEKGWSIWGHVFHWSKLENTATDQPFCFRLEKEGKQFVLDGLLRNNVVAGYFHIHFAGNLRWAERFLALCRNSRQRMV